MHAGILDHDLSYANRNNWYGCWAMFAFSMYMHCICINKLGKWTWNKNTICSDVLHVTSAYIVGPTNVFIFLAGHWRRLREEDRHVLDHWYLWRANDSRAVQYGSGEAWWLPCWAGLLSFPMLYLVIWHLSLLIWFGNLWYCICLGYLITYSE
jgi:hypothetical protein